MTAPPSSKADVTIQLVEGVFKLIDRLDSKVVLRPETKTKLKKVREELDENIKKEAVAEKLEEVIISFRHGTDICSNTVFSGRK